jgi:lipoprotein-releasing system permease protein
VEGKSFADSLIVDSKFKEIAGIANYSRIIEEDAWLQYSDYNSVATIKGVPLNYADQSTIDSMMYFGNFTLQKDSFNYAVLGLGVYSELRLPRPENDPPILLINAPIRGKKLSRYKENAFNRANIMVSGAFSVNAELDVKYLFVPLNFARELFAMDDRITSVELSLADGANEEDVKKQLESFLPKELKVETRYDRNALVYKTNASEKWFTFLILLFILGIACFNIIASLTMLIIEKKKDIRLLESLGATRPMIDRIFIYEGIFINTLGALIGAGVGLGLCYAQQTFGLVTMQGAMVEYYPVLVKPLDVVGIIITVLLLGSIFSLALVGRLMKRFAWQ